MICSKYRERKIGAPGRTLLEKEMVSFWQDLRYGFRMLVKSPGFTIFAVSTLAIGIGAVTAIFSVVNSVLMRPLPFDQPGQIVQLWGDPSGDGRGKNSVSATEFLDWKEQSNGLENISIDNLTFKNLTGNGQAQRLKVLQVSASYLRILHVQPLLGRDFLPDEDQPGKDKSVLLSYRLWQQYFGGDKNRVGQPIRLGDDHYTVIGVLPPKPAPPDDCDIFVPFVYGSEPWHYSRSDNRLRVIARLRPDVTVEQARAELNAIKQRLNDLYPDYKKKWGVSVVPLHEEITGEIRPQLWILFSAVGFVLLIACANVANLLLIKAETRKREIALRMALGGTRWRVVRQLVTESMILSLLGGGLGVLLAFWGVDMLTLWKADSLPRVDEIGVDGVVLGFALLASIVTGLLFGLAPAWQFAKSNLNETLKEGTRGTRGSSGVLSGGLIVGEVALAVVLLAGAGLLLKTLFLLQSVPLGFNPKNALTIGISLNDQKYPQGDQRVAFLRQITQRLESLPGVEAVGSITSLPMSGSADNSVRDENQPEQAQSYVNTAFDFVSGNYYQAMGIRVLKGRVIGDLDNTTSAPRVAVINQALASKVFPNADPIGRRVRMLGESWQVVGLVDNVRHQGLDRDKMERIYLPQAFSFLYCSLVARTKASPLSLAETVRREFLAIDPDQPISDIRTLEQVVANSIADRRLVFLLLGIFSETALLLAAVGLYGVMAQSVVHRTREIGIRLALGAQRGEVVSLILGKGMKLTALGVVAGLLGAFVVTRVLSHLLFGVAPTDPITYIGVTASLGMVAALACWLPARRAAKVDPLIALRGE